MKFKIRYAEQITGIFVLLAIMFVALVLILMGINQRWFKNDPAFTSVFRSADGLNRGMSIKLKGFQIGTVKSIRLMENNRVEIHFSIFENYHEKVLENSLLQLSSNPLGLGGGLLLHPGRHASQPLPDGSFIPSSDFAEGRRLITEGLVEITESDAVNVLMADVSTILGNTNTTIISLGKLISAVTDTLEGRNSGPVGGTLQNVETITDELASSMNELTTRLNASMANVEVLTDELSRPGDFISGFAAPDSSIAMMLNDKAVLYGEVEEILKGINASIAQVEELSVYINDTTPQIAEIIEDGRVALGHGKEVLEGLKNNPLLRGGISETKEQAAVYQSYRDKDF